MVRFISEHSCKRMWQTPHSATVILQHCRWS